MFTMNLAILQSMSVDKLFYLNAFKDAYAQNSFFQQHVTFAIDLSSNLIGQANLTPDLEKLLYGFVTGALHITLQWVNNNFPEAPEKIADIICRVVPQELRQYLIRD